MTTIQLAASGILLIDFILVVMIIKLRIKILDLENRHKFDNSLIDQFCEKVNKLIKKVNELMQLNKALKEKNTNLENIYRTDNFETKLKNGEQN